MEIAAARWVIAFLEDRRVLYAPEEMEVPSHCVQSVIEIRHHLSDVLGKLAKPSSHCLRSGRAVPGCVWPSGCGRHCWNGRSGECGGTSPRSVAPPRRAGASGFSRPTQAKGGLEWGTGQSECRERSCSIGRMTRQRPLVVSAGFAGAAPLSMPSICWAACITRSDALSMTFPVMAASCSASNHWC